MSLRKFQIYCEMKGQEFKAEDHLKDFAKIVDRIYESLEEAKELSCIWIVCQSELMSGYLKLARPEKVQKIHADYQG
jgi:hypothetical protein